MFENIKDRDDMAKVRSCRERRPRQLIHGPDHPSERIRRHQFVSDSDLASSPPIFAISTAVKHISRHASLGSLFGTGEIKGGVAGAFGC